MKKFQDILSLLLLLSVLQIQSTSTTNCSPHPDKTDLNCYSDYNRVITCMWNDTSASKHKDSVCRIHTESPTSKEFKASCVLEPVDFTKPAIKKCSMVFTRKYSFTPVEEYTINLSCSSLNKTETKKHKPACHVKVKTPEKPSINSTTVSWLAHVPKHLLLNTFATQLEWKQQDQSWSDPLVKKTELNCEQLCEGQLDPEMLTQGETYEARVRVRAVKTNIEGIWSDWSPALTWVSSEGRPKPPPEKSMAVWNITIAGAVAFVLISIGIFLSKEKTVWIYVVKKITGPPLPNPSKSSSIHKWSNLLFTSESFDSCSKEEIASLQLIPTVDAVQVIRPEDKPLKENIKFESGSSGFSNPSYSTLCPPPPLPLLSQTSNDLLLHTQHQQQTRKTETSDKRIEVERENILELLLKDSNIVMPMPVYGYEKVENLRKQSVDSGTCCCEGVSSRHAEADRFALMDGVKEGTPLKKEWDERNDGTIDFHELFGSSKSDFGMPSIQVCFEYKRVSTPQADSPELPSLDSGLNSTAESQEESMEVNDTSTRFPFPCSSLSLSQHDLNSCGSGLDPVLESLLSPGKPDSFSLVPSTMTIEPSGNGYMPVRQE